MSYIWGEPAVPQPSKRPLSRLSRHEHFGDLRALIPLLLLQSCTFCHQQSKKLASAAWLVCGDLRPSSCWASSRWAERRSAAADTWGAPGDRISRGEEGGGAGKARKDGSISCETRRPCRRAVRPPTVDIVALLAAESQESLRCLRESYVTSTDPSSGALASSSALSLSLQSMKERGCASVAALEGVTARRRPSRAPNVAPRCVRL